MLTNHKLLKIAAALSMRRHQIMICNRFSCTSSISTSFYRIVASADYYPRASVDHSQLRQVCSSSPSRKLPVLTLYTKQPCPLCDEALQHLEPFLDQPQSSSWKPANQPSLLHMHFHDQGNRSQFRSSCCDDCICQLHLPEIFGVNHPVHRLKVILEKVDITNPENRAWWKLYRYDIPVFHLDGRYLMKHKADLGVFKTALNDFHKKCTTCENSTE